MRGHNNIVVVTGISASGKDYLLTRALEVQPDSRRMSILPFGSLLSERVRQTREPIEDRDDLQGVRASLVIRCARDIVKEVIEKNEPTVINTHLAYKSGDSIVVNPAMDSIVRPRDYIFVRADPNDIFRRRAADTTRRREQEDVEAISLHQEIAQGVVCSIARVLRSGVTVIENGLYNVEQNVNTMRNVLYG